MCAEGQINLIQLQSVHQSILLHNNSTYW